MSRSPASTARSLGFAEFTARVQQDEEALAGYPVQALAQACASPAGEWQPGGSALLHRALQAWCNSLARDLALVPAGQADAAGQMRQRMDHTLRVMQGLLALLTPLLQHGASTTNTGLAAARRPLPPGRVAPPAAQMPRQMAMAAPVAGDGETQAQAPT